MTPKRSLDEIAAEIAMGGKPTVAIDPATIMLIISLIQGAIKLWQECFNKKDLVGARLTRFQKRRLARLVRQHVPESEADSVHAGIVKIIPTLTAEEVDSL